jgi:hypothetical protein
MKTHIRLHVVPLLILPSLLLLSFSPAAIPDFYEFREGSAVRKLFLAQDEVYIEVEKGVTIQKWDGLLANLIESANILTEGSQSALVQIPFPQDYSSWYTSKNSQAQSQSSKLSIYPVLYSSTSGQYAIEQAPKGSNLAPRLVQKGYNRNSKDMLVATSDIIIAESDRTKVESIAQKSNAQGFRELGNNTHYWLSGQANGHGE